MSITVKLIEEEKKQLTFGDVPLNKWFVTIHGKLGTKINHMDNRQDLNCIIIDDQLNKSYTYRLNHSAPITRILDGIEITEATQ